MNLPEGSRESVVPTTNILTASCSFPRHEIEFGSGVEPVTGISDAIPDTTASLNRMRSSKTRSFYMNINTTPVYHH